jgi:hypothetical protein
MPDVKELLDAFITGSFLKADPKWAVAAALADSASPSSAPTCTNSLNLWPAFQDAVRSQSQQVPEKVVNRVLRVWEAQFSQLLHLVTTNGYEVDAVYGLLVERVVEEIRADREREECWIQVREEVRIAAQGLMSPEEIEGELESLRQRYRGVMQRTALKGWSQARAKRAAQETLFGGCPITRESVRWSLRALKESDANVGGSQDSVAEQATSGSASP